MDRRQFHEFLVLSHALEDYFEGDYWGDEEFASYYDENVQDIMFQYKLVKLADTVFESDNNGSQPLD